MVSQILTEFKESVLATTFFSSQVKINNKKWLDWIYEVKPSLKRWPLSWGINDKEPAWENLGQSDRKAMINKVQSQCQSSHG